MKTWLKTQKNFLQNARIYKSIFPVNIDSDRIEKAVEETSFNKLQIYGK